MLIKTKSIIFKAKNNSLFFHFILTISFSILICVSYFISVFFQFLFFFSFFNKNRNLSYKCLNSTLFTGEEQKQFLKEMAKESPAMKCSALTDSFFLGHIKQYLVRSLNKYFLSHDYPLFKQLIISAQLHFP